MNRERLQILADHLRSLPDERVRMSAFVSYPDESEISPRLPVQDVLKHCGTAACIAGWANGLFNPLLPEAEIGSEEACKALGISEDQKNALFFPRGYSADRLTRSDAIAAIQSMLDSPDDDALPIWPQVGES